jgi:hypothetical protein
MNRLLMSFCLAAAAILAAPAVRAADTVGIPVCDDFLVKYQACLTNKVPAAQQAAFNGTIDQARASWAAAAKNPEAKPSLEAACKQMTDQMKTSLAPYGCSF